MAMTNDLGYGRRLTDQNHAQLVRDLYMGSPAMPSKDLDRTLRRKELDLSIDHRLGCDFPSDRREAMWKVAERVERKRGRLILRHLVRRIFPRSLANGANGLAGFMVDEYAKVLSPAELREFFDLEPGERPTLPIEPDQTAQR